MRLVFDIETDNFVDSMTKIHCIAVQDLDSDFTKSYKPDEIDEAINTLANADVLIGHNIIGFDLKAIKKIYPDFVEKSVIDTLVISRLVYSGLKDKDFIDRHDGMPLKLYGSHSLKAWGHRLSEYKDEYEGGFEEYNEDMLKYMEQDVVVTRKLYDNLIAKQPAKRALRLEHDIAYVCADIEETGFAFDKEAATELYGELSQKRDEISNKMAETFEPKVIQLKTKTKVIPFNPSSRQQIADALINKYNWKPKHLTPKGSPKIDENILNELDYEEAQMLSEYFMLEKRLAMLADGDQGYLKLVDKNNLLRGRYIPNGAVSGRATHFGPNMAQVPSMRLPFGKEIRSCFTVPAGWRLVGVDLSGLELRCLAHYASHWDNGAYTKAVLDGDIHTSNQEAAGLPTRDSAKTFIYSLIYGAGDAKLGEVIGKGRDAGKAIREKFFASMPAIKQLRNAVIEKYETQNHLLGLDERKLFPRSSHSALNILLQSAGAVISKQWLINARKDLKTQGFSHGWGADYVFSAWVHDEVQVAVREGIEEDVGNIIRRSAQKAGEDFEFRCGIDANFSVGCSWATTH